MADRPKLLGISGSLRQGSRNTALLHEAVRAFGPCEAAFGDIRMPLYDGDVEAEAGLPEAARALDAQARWADAVVIACPEYNKTLPGGLKNALDWLSRARPVALEDKPVAIVSAANGRSGGEMAQLSLRMCLSFFRARTLVGPSVFIPAARGAFDEGDRLCDEKSVEVLGRLMQALRAEVAR